MFSSQGHRSSSSPWTKTECGACLVSWTKKSGVVVSSKRSIGSVWRCFLHFWICWFQSQKLSIFFCSLIWWYHWKTNCHWSQDISMIVSLVFTFQLVLSTDWGCDAMRCFVFHLWCAVKSLFFWGDLWRQTLWNSKSPSDIRELCGRWSRKDKRVRQMFEIAKFF